MRIIFNGIIVLFLLNSFSGRAQPYTPLVVDSTHWIIEHCDFSALPPSGNAWEYYILGDTVVNLIQYKKVYTRGWDFIFCNITQPNSPYQLFSLIREDTINKKVYSTGGGLACPSGNDTLLYDFDLQITDTINTCITGFETISTITLGNPWLLSRKFTTNNNYELYEGVGSNFGLFERMELSVSGGGDPRLTHFCRGDISNCGLTVSINNEANYSELKNVYPNPITNNLIINYELDGSKKLEIEIYSIDGKIQFSGNMITDRINIDVSNFSPGIYFIKLFKNHQIVLTQKLIKSQ